MSLLKALQHISELEHLIQECDYEIYLSSHLMAVKFELQRQLSLTKSQNSPKLEE
jgi:hypothetical protein